MRPSSWDRTSRARRPIPQHAAAPLRKLDEMEISGGGQGAAGVERKARSELIGFRRPGSGKTKVFADEIRKVRPNTVFGQR